MRRFGPAIGNATDLHAKRKGDDKDGTLSQTH